MFLLKLLEQNPQMEKWDAVKLKSYMIFKPFSSTILCPLITDSFIAATDAGA